MATGPKGEIYAAWRHVFAGNMRDMGFTMSRDGGKTFTPLTRVNQDGWSIQGCPDDGPAMAVDAKGDGASGLADGEERAGRDPLRHLAGRHHLHDAGAAADARRPEAVASADRDRRTGRVFVAWDEVRDGVRRAAIVADRRIGSRPEILGESTSYPVMAAAASGLVAVWTSGPPDRSAIGCAL